MRLKAAEREAINLGRACAVMVEHGVELGALGRCLDGGGYFAEVVHDGICSTLGHSEESSWAALCEAFLLARGLDLQCLCA